MKFIAPGLILLWTLWACSSPSEPANQSVGKLSDMEVPARTFPPADVLDQVAQGDSTPFAQVFAPWDGQWQGTFEIWTDSLGQRASKAQPRLEDHRYLDSLPLKLQNSIQVEQTYASTSPYYQTVRIVDTYASVDGQVEQFVSTGYNQVKGDQLLCVVHKPDEQVIHVGTSLGNGAIIWERKLTNPTKIEYFYETTTDSSYQISGWGYYGADDPGLSPKTWFKATYRRQH